MMKQVGEAVRDFSLSSSCKEGDVITIGVATWGTIHNREELVHPTVSSQARVSLGHRRKAGSRGRGAQLSTKTAGSLLGVSVSVGGGHGAAEHGSDLGNVIPWTQ